MAGHRRLSEQTIHGRFLGPKPRLTSSDLRYLTEVDGTGHVALVATLVDDPGALVAVGRFVRDAADPSVAEFAIVVADAYQGRGLGKGLGMLLADEARARGITRFTATALSENVAVQRLIAAISEHLVFERRGSVTELVAELAA